MTDQPSSSDFIQASRVLKVKSPLGEDQLLPERMVIQEGVSQLFEINLSVRAKKEAVKPEETDRPSGRCFCGGANRAMAKKEAECADHSTVW